MKKYNNLTMCIWAAICASSPLQAEQSCDPDKEKCEPLLTLEKVSVTATRSETDTAIYAGSIGILTAEGISKNSNVIDGLAQVPGFESGGDTGRNIGSQYSIRGFGYQSEQRVIIRQDGVPRSPSLFSNHISNFRTDPDLLKRVEVVKGASSILYGSGAIGGIVDMQTKSAADFLQGQDNFGGLVAMRYESNDMKSIRGALFGQSKDMAADFVIYSKKSKHGDIDLADGGNQTTNEKGEVEGYKFIENDEDIQTSFVTAGFDLTPEQRLSIAVFDYDETLDTTWQTLYHVDINDESPIVGSLQETDYTLDYSYNNESNDWLDLSAKLYKSKAYYSRGWDNFDSETNTSDTLTYKNQEARFGFNIKNVAKFALGDTNHTLLMGVEFNNREETAVYNRNGIISDFGSMPNTYDDWGFYLHDMITVDKFIVTLAGRLDKFDRSVDLPGKTDYDDSNFSPRIATTYAVTQKLNVLLGYSETFRAPTPHETSSEGALNPHYHYLPNPDLNAETAKEVEGGFSYIADSLFTEQDQLSAKVTYFDGKIEDMITLERLEQLGEPEDASYFAQYRNVDNAKRKGYEVELSYLLDKVQFDSSYEHLDLYDEETKEKVMQGFADKLRLSLSYNHFAYGLNLGLSLNHWFKPDQNPKTITSRGVTYTYVDQTFTQLNLHGSYELPHFDLVNYAKIKFGVQNLTDKKYINARSVNTTARVGTGRNVYLDLEFSL